MFQLEFPEVGVLNLSICTLKRMTHIDLKFCRIDQCTTNSQLMYFVYVNVIVYNIIK